MISILLPTRSRPSNILRLIESLNQTTCDKENVELIIRYDSDDVATDESISLFEAQWKNIVFLKMPKPQNYGILWNEAFAVSHGDIVMICGDDIVFRTKDWDTIVNNSFESFPDKILLAYGRDTENIKDSEGLNPLPSHPFLHRKWVEVLGYLGGGKDFTHPIDIWILFLARGVSRVLYIPSIYTEHFHWTIGKSEKDAVYNARDNDFAAARERFYWASPERDAEVASLQAFIDKHAS